MFLNSRITDDEKKKQKLKDEKEKIFSNLIKLIFVNFIL